MHHIYTWKSTVIPPVQTYFVHSNICLHYKTHIKKQQKCYILVSLKKSPLCITVCLLSEYAFEELIALMNVMCLHVQYKVTLISYVWHYIWLWQNVRVQAGNLHSSHIFWIWKISMVTIYNSKTQNAHQLWKL